MSLRLEKIVIFENWPALPTTSSYLFGPGTTFGKQFLNFPFSITLVTVWLERGGFQIFVTFTSDTVRLTAVLKDECRMTWKSIFIALILT